MLCNQNHIDIVTFCENSLFAHSISVEIVLIFIPVIIFKNSSDSWLKAHVKKFIYSNLTFYTKASANFFLVMGYGIAWPYLIVLNIHHSKYKNTTSCDSLPVFTTHINLFRYLLFDNGSLNNCIQNIVSIYTTKYCC